MIEVKQLTKRYAEHVAVDSLSFTIEDGEIYGLLGPNGAGKTTTMNIMTGYLAPSEGTVVINGHDIFDDPREAKKCIGYLPELPPLYPAMTVREYLFFVAELKEIEHREVEKETERVMKLTGCDDVAGRLIKNLSKGYRQRIGVAQAMLGDPDVIILDEPTVGLDPKQIIEIRSLIKELGNKHTVILSSHILQEVSAVCDHILILSHGRLVAQDTPENLQKRINPTNMLSVTARASEDDIKATLGDFGKISFLPSPNTGETAFTIESDAGEDLRDKIFLAMANIQKPILSMSNSAASLEDVFLELTNDKAEDIAETKSEGETK